MAHFFSPTNTTTTTTSRPSSPVPTQPTYTTAGTLYNPGSTQPLQPPTRRGRSFKWPAPGQHLDLTLLPKPTLAPLPLKFGGGGRPTTYPSLQRYSPLQQNYDRAASPPSEIEQTAMLSMNATSMRSTNLPTPLPPSAAAILFPDVDQDRSEERGTSASDGDNVDDDDSFNGPLSNMAVKSLQNLASYPNPIQKKAQKALLRGAKPKMNNHSTGAGSNISSSRFSVQGNNSFGNFQDVGGRPPSTLRSVLSDPSVLRRAHMEGWPKATDFNRAPTAVSTMSRLPSPVSAGDGADMRIPTPTTLASGPGAPRPLTAGPPGQRQYRPSTFESTFKALNSNSSQSTHITDEDVVSITEQTLRTAGIDDIALSSDSFSSPDGAFAVMNSQPQSTCLLQPLAEEFNDNHLDVAHDLEQDNSGEIFAADSFQATDLIAPSIWNLQLKALNHCSWSNVTPSFRARFKEGTDRLNEKEIGVRNMRNDRCWYAGCDFLDETAVTAFSEAPHRQTLNSLGVIGDRRPVRNNERRFVDIAEANRTPVSEHAEPLVNLALASLVRNAEEASHQQARLVGSPDRWLRSRTT